MADCTLTGGFMFTAGRFIFNGMIVVGLLLVLAGAILWLESLGRKK